MSFIKSRIYLLFLLAGCKCMVTTNPGTIPQDVKSISIQMFENRAILVNPNLSLRFTEMMKDKFLKSTKLTIVPTDGDFRMSGDITEYKVEPVATNTNTGSVKNRFTMSVKAVFECPNHKDLNFTQSFTRFVDFDASQNFQSIEQQLSEDLSSQIIQEIFNKIVNKF